MEDLSVKDRWMIVTQLRILQRLYPEESEEYQAQIRALASGFRLHYDDVFLGIDPEELSIEECRLVLDILEMYRDLTFSYERLEDKEGIDSLFLKFPGFDGNHETKFLSYARYFIIDLKRYDELRYGEEFPDFNSHARTLPMYERMLEVWRRHRDKVDPLSRRFLTKDEINEILGGREA